MAIYFVLVVPLVLALVFLILGLLHVYWAFNGSWNRNSVVPAKEDGSPLFEIGPISCLLVAGLLFCLCAFFLAYWASTTRLNRPPVSAFFINSPIFIGLGFIVRAIGDFKYVGFFKSVRNTQFGRLDSKYFSPLCLMLGLGSLALYFLTH